MLANKPPSKSFSFLGTALFELLTSELPATNNLEKDTRIDKEIN